LSEVALTTTLEEDPDQWDAIYAGYSEDVYTILENTVKELLIPEDKREDFHIEKADMKKT
jgi:hypothetical protein